MIKLFKSKNKTKNLSSRMTKRIFSVFTSLILAGVLLTVYFLMPAMGAPVDLLNGNGSLDNSAQVSAWTLTNVTGINNWALDTSNRYAGTGSGRLTSPTGNAISYNGYVAYRFTPNKLPVSASLNVAYRKNYYNGQPSSGNWTAQAEIWQVGGASPLQTITINTGTSNTSWTNLTNLNVTALTQANTQYELRLVQKGRTGVDAAAYEQTWFDSVQLNVTYDSTPPQVVSASAPTDHNVDLVFNETLNQASAQTIANYSISPALSITGAALQADGKTVRLTTAAQTQGTNYTVTANNVQDISSNGMTTPGNTTFTGVDTTLPTVLSATALTDTIVNVKFSEPVDTTTAQNPANYAISPNLAVTSAAVQPDGQTVQLITVPQTYGTNYTITVANVKDLANHVISGSNTAAFFGLDTTAPTLVSASPATDKTVLVVFSELVDAITAQNPANYSISPGLVVASAILQADQKTVLLTTTTGQTKGTAYTVSATGVTDVHSNVVNGNNTAVFTGLDTTPPQVVSAVPVSDTKVNVQFDKAIDLTTAQNATNYSISPALAINSAVLQADGKTIQLTTAGQSRNTIYTVTVNNVKDTTGNTIAGSNTAVFTGLDNTPPAVISATAVNGTTVDLLFNEAVDVITAQTISNYGISPILDITNAVLLADGKTVRLTTAKQTFQALYLATVTNVKDLAGNTISNNNTASFSGTDSTSPTVVSAAGITYNTVDVIFSEPVDTTTAQTIANYSISPSLVVKSAVLQPDGGTVKLTTAVQTGGTNYTVNISGVADLSGNPIDATNNSAAFVGTSPPVTTAPKVMSATAPDISTVEVVFDATLDPTMIGNPADYSISPALTVTGVILKGDGVTVKLTTSPQTNGTTYTVTVANVQDIYGNLIGNTNNSAAFTGSGVINGNPHGNYLSNTDQCAKCHVTHTAQGGNLIKESTQSQACYLCHDAGGQSQYDVADQFGKTAPYSASHHKIPEGTQQCSDCHNPHDGGMDGQGNSVHWPRLLQSKADPTSHGGNQFCFSCHQNAQGNTRVINPATYPAEGVGHNNPAFTVNGETPFKPASGTGIGCAGCHEEHGSSIGKLLKTNPNKDTTNATAANKSQCYECHPGASADNRYLGNTSYDDTTYNPHALTTSTKTNVAYPGVTGQAGQCANCHDPHGSANGTSKVTMKTLRGVYNDGKTSYTASDFTFCYGCHNNSSADGSYDIQSQYQDPVGGHRIKTAGGTLAVGSELPCEACHGLHGSQNNNKHLLNDSLGSNLGDGRNECLACHQTGKTVEGIAMSPPPTSVPQHTDGTTACLTCHGSPHKVSTGISNGGVDCSNCHSTVALAISSTTSGYHHLMTDTAATYSTTQNGTRNCLSCHVDHNKFNNQKAFNLKANFAESFLSSDTTPGQNADFNAADATYGGLCLSCHQATQAKGFTQPDGSTATPPISLSGFTNSAHNYTATSTFGDNTVFNANCSKCHNDDMTKDKQTSPNKFGTHNSGYGSILSNFGDQALTNPLNQQFCYKCHNTNGDAYGTTMSTLAKAVQSDFAKASKHDITGASGAQLTCANCHSSHNVSKNTYSAGLSTSDISDPSNTLNSFTTASGSFSAFCLKCHDGTPPVALSNGTTLVPASVNFPNLAFSNSTSGWNKTSYTSAGHATQGNQCNACHDPHGSANSRLTLLPEDPATAPSSTSGVCLKCHGNQTGRPTGATNVYTDLTSGSDNTYRHPSLYQTGMHSDTETYPWTTANRHAECADCHDPHTANSTAGTSGNASGKLAGVTGVTPTYPTTNSTFAAPSSYSFGAVTKEYQLCFKCHSGYNGNFPTPPTGVIAESDLSKEFNPANPSLHDVGLYTGAARSYVGSFQTGTGMTGNTVLYCSSCHGQNTTATALTATSSPVHGSSNKYIIKGPWTSSLTISGSTASNNLCLKCHNVTAGQSRFTDSNGRNLHADGNHTNRTCQSCHSENPHGGKRPSLLTVMSSSTYTGTYKYDASYDGVYGTNSRLYLKNWKSSGTVWNKNDCGCNGSSH